MFKRSAKPAEPTSAASSPSISAKTLAAKAGSAKILAPGKQAYEARRAEKAGVSLERWMADKQKREQAERAAAQRQQARQLQRKPGLIKRLLDKAHKPL